jgi:hypothetical protein
MIKKVFNIGYLLFFIILSCSLCSLKVLNLNEKYNIKINYIDVDVLSESLIMKGDKGSIKIGNMFDSKLNTCWFLQAGYKGGIQFIFKKPIYIQKILILVNNRCKYGYKINTNEITINFYKDENTVFSDGFNYKLVEGYNNIVIPNNLICSLLKSKMISISINDNLALECDGIFIDEIKLFTTEKPFFEPRLSINQIISKYKIKVSSKWNINNSEYVNSKIKIQNEESEVINNLVYAALKGNEIAEKVLYNYSPLGTSDSEYISFLIDWYEQTKKER